MISIRPFNLSFFGIITLLIGKNFRLHASLIPAHTRGMQVFQSEGLGSDELGIYKRFGFETYTTYFEFA